MKVLFLDGLGANPAGFKPTFLRGQGFEVLYPVLPDNDFTASVHIAQKVWAEHAPCVVVGYSRGGAVAMALDDVETPLVLLAPAWRACGVSPQFRQRLTVLHSAGDDLVPLEDSRELLRLCRLPDTSLVVVGEDHTMIDEDVLNALLGAVRAAGQAEG
jgi:fermentation-respiration switch protein FrsA (DUF1100 family)